MVNMRTFKATSVILTAMITTLSLGTESSEEKPKLAEVQQTESKSTEHDATQQENLLSWEIGTEIFKEAFFSGDVDLLKSLKNRIDGFANINDLGPEFFEYGPGFEKWTKLIVDAKANSSKQHLRKITKKPNQTK